MRPFTFDAESVNLTDGECVAFSQLVTQTCHTSIQCSLSAQLAGVTRPYPETAIDSVQSQARYLWRTAVKLLGSTDWEVVMEMDIFAAAAWEVI